jgi:pimeloyl-ACP methyl ester carboxylesterase
MSKPTIVCVPGSWHVPDIYNATMAALNERGYPTIGCALASVGAEEPLSHVNFDGDVKGIRDCLTHLIEGEQKEVVLVAHSYAGMPAAEAPAGLTKSEREAKGLQGGLIRLVVIMGFVVPEGYRVPNPEERYEEWMNVDKEKGTASVDLEAAKSVFYNDLSPEEGAKWAAKLRPQSMGVYNSTTTYAAWRHVPSTYVIAAEDKAPLTPAVAKIMIDAARQQVPTAFDVVETCEGGGHCLMIGHPEWLAGVLQRAAGEFA